MTSGGLADQSGISLGDIILEINEEDATQLTLAEANEKINATPAKKILFLLRRLLLFTNLNRNYGEKIDYLFLAWRKKHSMVVNPERIKQLC